MFSLKKSMEEQLETLLRATLKSYQSTLCTMGSCAKQAIPHIGDDLQQRLLSLQAGLSPDVSAAIVLGTERRAGEELQQWGSRAEEYLKEKVSQVKEIVTLMAQAAQTVSERDQKYVEVFEGLTARLQAIGNLEDLTEIRRSLAFGTSEMKRRVDDMAHESQESIAQLRKQLLAYQTRTEAAEQLASKDSLTGLNNRRSVEQVLAFLVTSRRPFSILILDLNNFKEINDSYGHLAGDQLLKQFAVEMQSFFTPPARIGRWGGDEFIVILDGGMEEAQRRIEGLSKWVFGEYTIQAGEAARKVRVCAATGLAEWDLREPFANVLQRADAAMYAQKKQSNFKMVRR